MQQLHTTYILIIAVKLKKKKGIEIGTRRSIKLLDKLNVTHKIPLPPTTKGRDSSVTKEYRIGTPKPLWGPPEPKLLRARVLRKNCSPHAPEEVALLRRGIKIQTCTKQMVPGKGPQPCFWLEQMQNRRGLCAHLQHGTCYRSVSYQAASWPLLSC